MPRKTVKPRWTVQDTIRVEMEAMDNDELKLWAAHRSPVATELHQTKSNTAQQILDERAAAEVARIKRMAS